MAAAGLAEVVDALAALSRILVGITARSLNMLDIDLTLSQYRIVVLLAARGPQRTVDLARELALHPSTVTRTCDRLIRRGLLTRQHRQPDRRVAWLALSESGKDLIGEVMRRRHAEIRRLVDAVPIEDPTEVTGVLDAVVTAAGDLPETQWWQRWIESTLDAG
ncbi:MarR family winged helix-turn-helix transcriptional regulator [Micromonospora zhanjiangensis]